MTPDIRELDEDTRDRIAAGEVIERPASVVKELLENALDADASRVAVAVEGGGTDRIVVSDDGVGMSESAVRKAVREHTTSKLRDVEELDAVGTLGFRGEALHAIGSVARLAIRTKPRGGSRGTELVVQRGEVVECGPAGCPEGTTVEVTDLFGNVPARRKYLKTEPTEFAHVQQVVAGYALASADVAVTLERDDREIFATAGDGDRRSAVMAVYGREVAASMIPIDAGVRDDAVGGGRDDADDGDGMEADADADADGGVDTGDRERPSDAGSPNPAGPLAGVEGLVSHPETNRSGREYVTTLVNGRYVNAGVVREAVVEAYGTQLAPDRYPFAVVDVSVPPGGVDVNVHPRKLEVLFADAEGVREQVTDAVESALLEEGLLRSRAPRGRSAAEQTEISVGEDAAVDAGVDPERPADPAAGSGSPESSRSSERSDGPSSDGSSTDGPPTAESRGDATTDAASADSPSSSDGRPASRSPSANAERGRRRPAASGSGADGANGAEPDRPDRKFREPPTQLTVDGEAATGAPEAFDRLPPMEVLGQLDGTYLVCEVDDGLVLVDQHAADERVNYERLRESFAGDVTTQVLADPVDLELTAREASLVGDHAEALARLGFRVQRPDDRTVRVTTVPALVAERVGGDAPAVARDLVGEFVGGDPGGTVDAIVDDLLGDLACHPSVTGNTSLREGTVAELLGALDDCENPWACPHGRPTLIEISSEEIEDRFERDYPGHGGRRE